MYLMYVDESGDPGLKNSPTRYFVLVGLVIHELRWQQMRDELVEFRRALKKDTGLRLRDEVHSARLLSRPSKDLRKVPKQKRLEILRRHADAIAKIQDVSLICVVVDKQGKPENYGVFEAAWRSLIQRFENTLSYRNFPGPKNPDERGMLLPDHTADKKLNELLRKMRVHNPVPNHPSFGEGYRNLVVRSVIEDASFRNSGNSYFVQCADVVACLLYQSIAPSVYMREKAGQNYFKRLDAILCKQVTKQAGGIVRI